MLPAEGRLPEARCQNALDELLPVFFMAQVVCSILPSNAPGLRLGVAIRRPKGEGEDIRVLINFAEAKLNQSRLTPKFNDK